MKKFKVTVAFNKEASDYAEENGMVAAKKEAKSNGEGWNVETFNFKTKEERDAFCKGMDLVSGYDCPYWEKNK